MVRKGCWKSWTRGLADRAITIPCVEAARRHSLSREASAVWYILTHGASAVNRRCLGYAAARFSAGRPRGGVAPMQALDSYEILPEFGRI